MDAQQLKAFVLEAEKRGDREGAFAAMQQLQRMQSGAPTPPQVGQLEGLAAQGTQGMWLGSADEVGAGIGTLASYLDPRQESQSAFEGQSFGDRYKNLLGTSRNRMDTYRAENPVKSTLANIVGGVSSPVSIAAAGLLAPLRGAELVKESTKLSGLLGATSGAGYSNAGNIPDLLRDTAKGGGIGASVGYAFPALGNLIAGKGATAVGQAPPVPRAAPPSTTPPLPSATVPKAAPTPLGTAPVPGAAPPTIAGSTNSYKQAVKMLQRNGVGPLSTGQKTGANWVKSMESSMAQTPIGGKPLQVAQEATVRSYQRKLIDMTAGQELGHDMLTQQAVDDLGETLSKQYVARLGDKTINIADDAFLEDLSTIEATHSELVDSALKGKVRQIVNEFLEKASNNPEQTGKWYQRMRSLFAKRAKGTSETAPLYGELKRALDDAFVRANGGKGDLDARFAQYKQLETLFNRVAGGSAGAEGFIPPSQLARLAGQSPGTREWREFTRAGAAVLPDRLGQSGSPERALLLNAVQNPISTAAQLATIRPLAGLLAGGSTGSRLNPSGLLQSPDLVRLQGAAGLLNQ